MRQRLLSLLSAVVCLALALSPANTGQAQAAEGRAAPNAASSALELTVPINLVFVGYEPGQVDADDVLDVLPAGYAPVVRYPQFYGLSGRDLGLNFIFDYHSYYADGRFEDSFFDYLAANGQPGPLTLWQDAYNDQAGNVLDVSGEVLYIDAPSTERWLMEAADHWLHIDVTRGYTIFFVNWYGRDDFKFHVYTKTDDPDPDTGYNFGAIRSTRKMIAWGGTWGRTWFLDLSAGPEAWSNNWNVDDEDVDGDGSADKRIPPVWEYVPGGYGEALGTDLGLVARFVAINLLFTTSPLYDPLVTSPGPSGGNKVVHIEMFEDDPNSQGVDWINPEMIYHQLLDFQPYYPWQVHLEQNDPIDAAAQRSLQIFSGVLPEADCWNDFGDPFAQLFCYFDAHLGDYVPAYGPDDYVGEVFAFNTTGDTLGGQFGLLGFADDNWVDGTQSYVFTFGAEEYRQLGYGFSSTTIHEVGHHIGMSHPHDGYDSELGIDYGSSGPFQFAWLGDESHTVMSYISLVNDFGQFDRDNLYRIETAGYLNWYANVRDQVVGHPHYRLVRHLIRQGDQLSRNAGRSFNRWDFLASAANARKAYEFGLLAAYWLGIEPQPNGADLMATLSAQRTGSIPREGDPVRFPND